MALFDIFKAQSLLAKPRGVASILPMPIKKTTKQAIKKTPTKPIQQSKLLQLANPLLNQPNYGKQAGLQLKKDLPKIKQGVRNIGVSILFNTQLPEYKKPVDVVKNVGKDYLGPVIKGTGKGLFNVSADVLNTLQKGNPLWQDINKKEYIGGIEKTAGFISSLAPVTAVESAAAKAIPVTGKGLIKMYQRLKQGAAATAAGTAEQALEGRTPKELATNIALGGAFNVAFPYVAKVPGKTKQVATGYIKAAKEDIMNPNQGIVPKSTQRLADDIEPPKNPLVEEAKKYKTAEEFVGVVKERADTVFRLAGNEINDISVVGSTARGKANPNDLDILITPKKLEELTPSNLKTRTEMSRLLESELQEFFPDKKIQVVIAKYDAKQGPKSQLEQIWKEANQSGIQTKLKAQKPLIEGTKIPSVEIKKRDMRPIKEKLSEVLERRLLQEQTLDEIYADTKKLSKYANKKTGELPEVTGKPTSQFAKTGDDIVDELGFESSESARVKYQDYLDAKKTLDDIKTEERFLKGEKRIVKRGEQLMTKAKGDRRASFNAIKNTYDLTDSELKPIVKGRDIFRMDRVEFDDMIKEAELKGREIDLLRQARNEVMAEIKSKDIKSVENLFKGLNLPRRRDLTMEQWEQVSDALLKVQGGDRVLGGGERRLARGIDENILTEQGLLDYFVNNGLKIENGKIQWKDISKVSQNLKDPFRVFKQVFGEKLADKLFLNDLRQAQSHWVSMIKKADGQLEYLTKKLGIKQGSKMSADVMKYGEKLKTKADLLKEYTPEQVDKIIEADTFFRAFYDMAIDKVNEVLAKIYPNDASKLVPKRKDYYRHFENEDDIKGFLKVLLGDDEIAGSLAGISGDTKPLTKWQSFKQKRTSDKTEYDAIGGFMDAVPQIAHAIHVDPLIPKLRGMQRFLGEITDQSKDLNNFLIFLNEYTNGLAGKTSGIIDRFIADNIGRKPLRVFTLLTNKVKRNQILYNLGTLAAQGANLPLAMGKYAKQPKVILKALQETLKGTENSLFKEVRKADQFFSKYKTGASARIIRGGGKMLTAVDNLATNFVFNLKYVDELGKGTDVKTAKRLADDFAREIQGGRGIGEKSIAQNSQTLGAVAPYTLEIANNMYTILDELSGAGMSKSQIDKLLFIIGTSVFLYGYNTSTEKIFGRRIAFDPINAIKDAVVLGQVEEGADKVVKPLGRLTGEVISNLPYGSHISEWIGDENFRKDFFGEADPSRFGTDPLLKKGIQEPLTYLGLPAGGGQVKKTIEGVKAWLDREVKKSNGAHMYDIGDSVWDLIQNATAGKYSGEQARDYFDPTKAKQLADEWVNLPPAEAAEQWAKLNQENPDLAKKVSKIVKDKRNNISSADKKIRELGVENGDRAKRIFKELNKLDTAKEKGELWNELKAKKILTDEVSKQVKYLLTQ